MAFANFTLNQLTRQFNLIIDETTDLFADVPAVTLRSEFQTQLDRIGPLAS